EEVVDPDNNIKESNETNNTSRILIDLATKPASNDNFTNATLIPGLTAGLFGANVQATKETGEPFHYSDAGGSSVWYKWTAPSTMNVTITTEGSLFDTVLAVYRGTAVNALTFVTNNDDVSSSNNSSRVTFSATNGTTYRIAVDGFGSNPAYSGTFQLNFNPALNDNFASAIVLTGNSGTTSGSNRGAGKQGGEPKHAGVTGGKSIWYNWTAPTTGPFVFDTLGSSFDTLLGIYTGNNVNGLTTVASDDDSGGAGTSGATLNATSGVTYRIAVDGKAGANGIVNLNWLGPGLPTIAAQPLATNNFTGSSVGFRVVAVSSSPLTYRWMFQGSNLTDNAVVSGSTNANLLLTGISTNNQGTYTVRISNSSGSITSAPANLIVLDSSRAVFVEELEGDMGGVLNVPIQMQALGNEHALNFSLLFNPDILSHPRITNSPVGATISVFTNSVSAGQFGVTLMLPTNQIVAPGTPEWARVLFDVVTGLPEGTTTQIGFGDVPITRAVSATNGATLTALFAAGQVTLHSIPTVETGTRLPDKRYQLLLNGIIGRNYCIEASSNLTAWVPINTNQIGTNGALLFIDNQATNIANRFYRAWLLP
ncbi:MAG: hypothetical protein JWM68_2281, partial [Verrucomicrobiales bacterium]|nr:hypothetical protein [Verrucomicrobiales bacterium]